MKCSRLFDSSLQMQRVKRRTLYHWKQNQKLTFMKRFKAMSKFSELMFALKIDLQNLVAQSWKWFAAPCHRTWLKINSFDGECMCYGSVVLNWCELVENIYHLASFSSILWNYLDWPQTVKSKRSFCAFWPLV